MFPIFLSLSLEVQWSLETCIGGGGNGFPDTGSLLCLLTHSFLYAFLPLSFLSFCCSSFRTRLMCLFPDPPRVHWKLPGVDASSAIELTSLNCELLLPLDCKLCSQGLFSIFFRGGIPSTICLLERMASVIQVNLYTNHR